MYISVFRHQVIDQNPVANLRSLEILSQDAAYGLEYIT